MLLAGLGFAEADLGQFGIGVGGPRPMARPFFLKPSSKTPVPWS